MVHHASFFFVISPGDSLRERIKEKIGIYRENEFSACEITSSTLVTGDPDQSSIHEDAEEEVIVLYVVMDHSIAQIATWRLRRAGDGGEWGTFYWQPRSTRRTLSPVPRGGSNEKGKEQTNSQQQLSQTAKPKKEATAAKEMLWIREKKPGKSGNS